MHRSPHLQRRIDAAELGKVESPLADWPREPLPWARRYQPGEAEAEAEPAFELVELTLAEVDELIANGGDVGAALAVSRGYPDLDGLSRLADWAPKVLKCAEPVLGVEVATDDARPLTLPPAACGGTCDHEHPDMSFGPDGPEEPNT
jgi:hypothetical protein